jgi:hypothetical protein
MYLLFFLPARQFSFAKSREKILKIVLQALLNHLTGGSFKEMSGAASFVG